MGAESAIGVDAEIGATGAPISGGVRLCEIVRDDDEREEGRAGAMFRPSNWSTAAILGAVIVARVGVGRGAGVGAGGAAGAMGAGMGAGAGERVEVMEDVGRETVCCNGLLTALSSRSKSDFLLARSKTGSEDLRSL